GVEGPFEASALRRGTDSIRTPPPTPPSVDEESSGMRPPIGPQAHASGCSTPATAIVNHWRDTMQTPSVALDIGADIGKDDVAMACADESFAPRKIRNQRAALLIFLKDLPAGSRIGMEATGSYHE